MAKSANQLVLSTILVFIVFGSRAESQSCQSYQFTNNKLFATCTDLPVLNAFLHWTYNSSTNSVQLAYRSTGFTSSKWVAWSLNPDRTKFGMEGTQALVAYQEADGALKAYTSSVAEYDTQLTEGTLSFPVSDLSAVVIGGEITIFATVGLPDSRTTLLQVWQEGPLRGGTPKQHDSSPGNFGAKGNINFLSGQEAPSSGGDSKTNNRQVHGALNLVSWGILMPLGMMIARYLKVFRSADPAWFYLHAGCQTTAYIVGVSGWATGLKLDSESKGVHYHSHGNIGATLFSLGLLQVFALLLRPNKEHKYRFYWNIYHHSVGYLVILLSIVNIYKGLDILGEKKWKEAYLGALILLVIVALLLEAFTWYIVIKTKKMMAAVKMQQGEDGGYHGRPQA